MPLDRNAGCTVNRIDGIAEEAMARELLRVDEIMAILPDTPLRIAALVEGLTPSQLRTSTEPAAWSVDHMRLDGDP